MRFLWMIIFFGYGFTLIGKDIRVSNHGTYRKIVEAIAVANPSDQIIVEKGIYKENNIVIDKPIQLIGEGSPVVDGNDEGDIFIIKSNHVTITGFAIQRSGYSSIKDYAGIKLENVSDCSILNNKLLQCYFAIYVSNSSNCKVLNNFIKGNAIQETKSGNGIHLWKSNNISIEYNTIYTQRDGIYLEFSTNCSVTNNCSEQNIRYGLHFMFSHGNQYICNVFRNNGAGVAVMYTEKIEMTDNIFEENWGPTSYGLLLKDIRYSNITRNKFINNTTGILMEAVSNVELTENEFITNGWGIKLMGNSVHNTITKNNFLDNTFDVTTNSFELGKQNSISGNYWDKYRGYDLDHNGIGDVPYRPVKLFSVYVERIPSAIVLLQSFTVELLDTVEQAMPAIIPETLSDVHPLMKKVSL